MSEAETHEAAESPADEPGMPGDEQAAEEAREAEEGADGAGDGVPGEDEPGDGEPGDGDELEAAAERPAVSEKEIEKATKKLESEATRHANRISEIMGEDAQNLIPCELCLPITPGFRFNMTPDEPTVARVREAIGMSDLTVYLPASDARKCDTCDGKGRVLSGSRVEQYATLGCGACKGKGWIPVGGARSEELVAARNGPTDFDPENPPEPPSEADPWGRLPDDPNYGVLPQFVRS